MNDADKIARLTEREKVSLQQWLQHKTAKEIAIDLGISHHAVEKRLRMARIKLGAATSLEAARMLRDAEQSGQTVSQSPEVLDRADRGHQVFTQPVILGAITMTLIAAAVLAFVAQGTGAPSEHAQSHTTPAGGTQIASRSASEPTAGTKAALRSLVAGLASGSPDYDKLSPLFAEVVRRDLPMTHPMFRGMGELKSVTFRERGPRGDDAYNLVFANGEVIMSAVLDAEGRMDGGLFRAMPGGQVVPTAGTEAALRSLVAGLASGSPDYDKLSPQFAEIVRRDLPMTHPMFRGMGELKSVTFRERGPRGDDAYDLVFADGEVMMSAVLDSEGRMDGGILRPVGPPAR